jgi:hypothetical protein
MEHALEEHVTITKKYTTEKYCSSCSVNVSPEQGVHKKE